MVGGDHWRRKIEEKIGKIDVSSATKFGDSGAGERAHRYGKKRGEERKGRRLTSDAGEAFSVSNWTGTGTDLHGGFPAIAADWISGLWWKGERRDLLLK